MKNSSIPEAKNILSANKDITLRIKLFHGDVFILELDGEIDAKTYDESGIWLCWIQKTVRGKKDNFYKLFKPGSGLDIRECDIKEILDESNGTTLYSAP